MNLMQVAKELERRMISIFETGPDGTRPAHGDDPRYRDDPAWRDLLLFYEYFHADTGKGLGASHQTGWTALVASMLRSQAGIPKNPADRRAVKPLKHRADGRTAQAQFRFLWNVDGALIEAERREPPGILGRTLARGRTAGAQFRFLGNVDGALIEAERREPPGLLARTLKGRTARAVPL